MGCYTSRTGAGTGVGGKDGEAEPEVLELPVGLYTRVEAALCLARCEPTSTVSSACSYRLC